MSVAQLSTTLCDPMDYSRMDYRLLFPWDFPDKNTEVGSPSLLHPGIKPQPPALQADSLSSEPPEKSIQNYT